MTGFEAIGRLDPDFFIHSGDSVYADGPMQETVVLPDGTVWRNVVTPEKSKVAETLDEFARRRLAEAARNSEEAVTGVLHGITAIIRTVVPMALVRRPESLIEATYALADQGLRVGRRLALTVGGTARELTRAA
jgi:hypothetical protein